MNQLPNGWCFAELGQLIRGIEAGLNVKCEERTPRIGERGLVKISSVTWGKFDEMQSKTLHSDEKVDERNRIKPGDLLFSRANTIELVGAAVIVDDVKRDLYLSDKVLRLLVLDASKRWVNYALKSASVRKAIQEASSGNQLSMRNISQDKLRRLVIPLAPANEQTRVADKIDSTLARVDTCRERLDRVAPLIKRFRQAVLAAATSGRLTEGWRDDIDALTAWRESTLGSVLLEMRNGLSAKPDENVLGTKILRISAVRSGAVNFEDYRYLEVDLPTRDQYSLRKDDLLFTRYNGSLEFVGVCAVVRCDQPGIVYPDKLIRARVDSIVVLPGYVEIVFGAPQTRHQVENFVKSSAGQKGISGTDLKSTKFLLPSLKEQTEIVRRVESLFAYADRLEARLKSAQAAAERLTPALLAKAFRGELVPQDPADEPAGELLKRLAAGREGQGKPKKRSTSAA
ncbi:restriction endonuclease subunit S [Sphaerotilus mobilis]|uniref:Type I restriction enzyme S subunit n=1 Tax=Sphaerotilus mobilis TaxID=47994 RepID=A0A4Q7LRM0_9BURK|nr:restriction endonuclease subunit S [Sphaerotilus mobilis]RZS57131.1 type I restriction enzyme S subunit [Sphaerotilus mobilis]